MKYQVTTQMLDDGSSYIELPPELLKEVGLQEGDIIEWAEREDGSYTFRKVEDESSNKA